MIGARGLERFQVSNGTLPETQTYGQSEDPLLPYLATGVVIAKDIAISGFNIRDKET